jgi:hypothetical protein
MNGRPAMNHFGVTDNRSTALCRAARLCPSGLFSDRQHPSRQLKI